MKRLVPILLLPMLGCATPSPVIVEIPPLPSQAKTSARQESYLESAQKDTNRWRSEVQSLLANVQADLKAWRDSLKVKEEKQN